MVKVKNKKIDLVSDNYQIEIIIDKLKMNKSLYERILKTLLLLGNFDRNISCQLYETHDEDDCSYIKLWCEDIDGNIFVLCPISSIKHLLYFIDKYDNEDEKHYDISLLKKFDITEENINLARIEQTYNFKFGRLITNNISFYNIFLGNNVCYQINIDGSSANINSTNLLNELNKLENIPTFKDYIEIFNKQLIENNISYKSIYLESFKNFASIGNLSILGDKEHVKKLSNKKRLEIN